MTGVSHLIVRKSGYQSRLSRAKLGDTAQVWLHPQATSASVEEVFTAVEQPANFPGGMIEFIRFLAKNIRYPPDARRLGIEGKVFVEFIIDTKGDVTNVKAVLGISPSLDNEAVRIIRQSPKWIPATQRGIAVKQQMVFPVVFKLG